MDVATETFNDDIIPDIGMAALSVPGLSAAPKVLKAVSP